MADQFGKALMWRRAPFRPTYWKRGVPGALSWLFSDELPNDVSEWEYSEVALFKASVLLNYATLGDPTMTFSARSHHARLTARTRGRWLFWFAVSALVDAACGVLRGESDHCETAWVNHEDRDIPNRVPNLSEDDADWGFETEDLSVDSPC